MLQISHLTENKFRRLNGKRQSNIILKIEFFFEMPANRNVLNIERKNSLRY